jgi:predicted lipid-binding transport protein (Tim44 family)
MADYHPLIARAVNGLDKNTGENRRALYDRARSALVNQLRSVEPALDESDITRERLALEESIRKVEAEAVKRTRLDATEAADQPSSISDQGLRGFRETVADAEGLGDATADANRAARDVYEAMPGDQAPQTGDREALPAEHDFEPAPRHEDDDAVYSRPARSYGRMIGFILLLLVLGGLAGGAYWQRDAVFNYWQRSGISKMVANFRNAPASKPRETAEPASRPKISDRIGPASGSPAANAPAAAVAQKVVLYDEDPSDPKGKRYVGSALWRTETVSPGPGLAPELAIRADVEIPERHMRMTWSLRRNTDKALPASHTIEIMFTLAADFPEGGIGNVPGVLMKQDEQARGVPLAGLAVKVTNGYFLIGLSAVDVDVQRNIQLLKERDWFDIPIVYTTGKRAILALEKGTPGVRAFEEALRAWGQ